MRCAVIISDLSYPPVEGLHEQMIFVLKSFSLWASELHVTIYCRDPAALALQDLWDQITAPATLNVVPYSGSMLRRGLSNRIFGRFRRQERRIVTEIQSFHPDVVHLDGALAAGLHAMLRAVPGVISWVDPGSRRQIRLAAHARRGKHRHLAAATLFYCHEILCRSRNKVWHVVSDVDRRFLQTAHPGQRTVQIPVSLPMSSRRTAPRMLPGDSDTETAPVTALIFADLRVPHLRHSLQLLIEKCLIPVSADVGRLNYVVLGRIDFPEQLREICRGLNITFISWVDDIQQMLESVDFVILPDQVGTGLKNRAVFALSLGCAVVGTPQAFEGIAIQAGTNAIVAGTWAEWQTGIVDLATDNKLRRLLQRNAHVSVSAFSPESVSARWKCIYEQIAVRTSPHG